MKKTEESTPELYNPHKLHHGAFIPNFVLQCKELSNLAKLCYGRLMEYSGPKGYCWPKQKTLAEELCCSPERIYAVLRELKEKGFIWSRQAQNKDKFYHRSNTYYFVKRKETEATLQPDDEEPPFENKGNHPLKIKGQPPFENKGSILKEKDIKNKNKKSFSKEKEISSFAAISPPQSFIDSSNKDFKTPYRRQCSLSPKPFQRIRLQQAKIEQSIEQEKPITITNDVQSVLDHWEEMELIPHKKHLKSYSKAIEKTKKLLKEFTDDQINEAISNFSIAVQDENFYPEDKTSIKKINLSDFIENTYFDKKLNKLTKASRFRQYFSPPKPITPTIENKHPDLVKSIENQYIRNIIGNSHVTFTKDQQNQLIMASNRLMEFWDDNRDIIAPYLNYGYRDKARLLIEAIIASVKMDDITPGYLCSNLTFNTRLPRYLNKQGVLLEGQSTPSMYDYRKEPDDEEEYRSPLDEDVVVDY